MAQTGLDETLKVEAVYLTGPVPRNLGVLTVLGAVFDTVYFPGVHMPKSGYDPKEVEKEIAGLEGLNDSGHDTQFLIGAMKLLLHAKTMHSSASRSPSWPRPLAIWKRQGFQQRMYSRSSRRCRS
jgi:hypothetical protein